MQQVWERERKQSNFVNITYVNVLAFIGGIGLAATQSQCLPESKLQQVVSPAATPSEDASDYSFSFPFSGCSAGLLDSPPFLEQTVGRFTGEKESYSTGPLLRS